LKTNISEKTLQDLEFTTVLEQVSEFCISDLGKAKTFEIVPIGIKDTLFFELAMVNEYVSSFENENRIPNHRFEDITEAIKRLAIENSYLETENFLKIATVTETVNEIKKFLKKFYEYYPTLFKLSDEIEFTTFVSDAISKIITSFGTVADNASSSLKQLRKDINRVRGKISESFSHALSRNIASGYLDDIKESIIDNQRVLAVIAMHRRKIKGSLLGSSKSGNIVYIAPQATLSHSRELQNLLYEEKQEVIKILRALAEEIRPFVPLLEEYLVFLTHLDVIGAKSKYAREINGLLPKIVSYKKVFLRDAFHPILWRKNNQQGIVTHSQTLELNDKQQIIVISGPNAT